MSQAEVLIVGGGLAGAALAIALARHGRGVLLLEREAEAHDKVCGEFLSHEAVAHLRALGVDPLALGAVPLTHLALAARGDPVEVPLPFPALSLSRRILDAALLDAAVAAGATVARGHNVAELQRGAAGWQARCSDGSVVHAAEAVLASGKHDLRGHARPGGRQNDLIGFKLHLQPRRPLPRRVELLLVPHGYAGLEPIEGSLANLCLLVRRQRFKRLDGGWPALLEALRRDCPLLDARLQDTQPLHPAPLAIARLPYGFLRTGSEDGLWHLGDRAAVIPSFAGAGMALALHSAARAAEAFAAGRDADAFQRDYAREVAPQLRRATWLSQRLVSPLYQPAAMALARLLPALLPLTAMATRIPRFAAPAPAQEALAEC